MPNPKNSQEQKTINPVKIVEKPLNEITQTPEQVRGGAQILLDMQREMKNFFELLMVDNQVFDAEKAFKELMKYIKTYERILYSTVSHIVYDLTDEDAEGRPSSNPDRFGTLLSNIEKLVEYADKDTNISSHVNAARTKDDKTIVLDTKKAVWKIWDHVNLAHRQYGELRQSDSEYDAKFEKRIERFQSKITGEMNAQLLSMVGIFTALAFILFGGISSLQNVLSGLKESHLLRLLIIGCVWGLGMMNVTFVFLFCIGKMTKLNFKSNQSPDATIWQRYPVICWTDFVLGSLLILLMWLYYCLNRGSVSWLDWLIGKNPILVSVIGFIALLALIVGGFVLLVKKTRPVVGDEDE